MQNIADFVRKKRLQLNLTQIDVANKAGVGLRFIRDLEQQKRPQRTDKLNQVLALFGHTLGPVPLSNKGKETSGK